MRKVIVIGCPGSGKSTFSRRLAEITGLPLFHLDMLHWNADGTNVPRPVFLERLRDVLQKDEWIIDGNYGSTMELRMGFCDTVFFLDYPLEVCVAGIKSRKGKPRPDMPCATLEDEDADFMRTVTDYESQSRPAVMALLQKHSAKKIVIFKTRNQADNFLAQMPACR